jgi:hypothetical protein
LERKSFRDGIRNICLDIRRNLSFNKDLHLFNRRKEIMSEIMDDYDAGLKKGQYDLNRIVALKEDLAYEKGLIAGFTKSIVLVKHLQRGCNYPAIEWNKLEQAMELISKEIKPNNE